LRAQGFGLSDADMDTEFGHVENKDIFFNLPGFKIFCY